MECTDCANPINPEWTSCEACGAPVDSASQPVAAGRKWAARLLRFLGMMVIGAAVLFVGISRDVVARGERPVFVGLAVAAAVMGGGINYAGRRLNPQAGKVTAWGVFGGLLGVGGAFLIFVIIVGLLVLGAIAAALRTHFGL